MVAVTVFRRPAMAAESGGRDGSSAEFMFKSGNQKSRTRVDLCFAPGHQGSDQSHQIKRCRISDQTHQTLHQATGHPQFRIPQIRESRFRRDEDLCYYILYYIIKWKFTCKVGLFYNKGLLHFPPTVYYPNSFCLGYALYLYIYATD
ncbi:uncharacterized protein LOC110940090 [Helianthus annuus]|uniref:uncharacterized protein LOC110940090 n=1 Tax=Helianthus annuus TaxID=4232 RepID=UPI000B8F7AB6|nr:uncharacterized protein LOC110940090 [Helianthus annuus]